MSATPRDNSAPCLCASCHEPAIVRRYPTASCGIVPDPPFALCDQHWATVSETVSALLTLESEAVSAYLTLEAAGYGELAWAILKAEDGTDG